MNSAAAAVLRNCYGAEIPAVDEAGNAHIFQGGHSQVQYHQGSNTPYQVLGDEQSPSQIK